MKMNESIVSLYEKRKITWLSFALATVFLFFLFLTVFLPVRKNLKYQEFLSSVPSAEEVSDLQVFLRHDSTLAFMAPDSYSFVILGDKTVANSLKTFAVGGNTLHALFMPADTPSMQETVLAALDLGLHIRTLYVPKRTDKTFLEAYRTKNPNGEIIKVSGGEYRLFKDCAVYLLGCKTSLSLTVEHGDNTFLYSYQENVGSLFKRKEAAACFMPYENLIESKLDVTYAFFPEADFNIEDLAKHADKYVPEYTSFDLYCLSDGTELLFDTGSYVTGRLQGE